MSTSSVNDKCYNPQFQAAFLLPKYWPTWIAIGFSIIFAFMPPRWRDGLARKLATLLASKETGVKKRTRVNLTHCFPHKSSDEVETTIKETFVKALQFMFGYSELMVRSTRYNQKRGILINQENLFKHLEAGEKVIILAPHAWAIDYPAVLLASFGYKVTNIMKPQKNLLSDWLMHKQRMQYGGRIFSRDAGIKPFLRSINEGYIGYWAADEDLGRENSVIVPFFGTEKATLKGFGKLAKLTKAKVVPILPTYNDTTNQYEVFILPALENFPTGNEEQDATMMNQALEALITPRPEHYMWNLRLLKTQRDNRDLYN